MDSSRKYFEVLPKLVRAGRQSTVSIRSLFGDLKDGMEYEIKCIPVEGGSIHVARARAYRSTIRLSLPFAGEGEYSLVVQEPASSSTAGAGSERTLVFSVYALEDDLWERRPFKGDLHMHSRYSDGRESPAYVAGACRLIGLDFMAVTDHGMYRPSLEAQAAFAGVRHDLRIFAGEEVHPPDNPVHIINFGGSFSLNELFRNEPDQYRSEVARLMQDLGELPAGVDRYQYASCLWCFERIRQAGGLGIFCHPYWTWNNRYYVDAALTEKLLHDVPFDALELISGYHLDEVESNMLQVARYNELRAEGRRIPIVGVSDAHGCETGSLFGWYYTIVFSPDLELTSLVASIKDLYSVAVEALPGDEPVDQQARVYGPYRLVKYARFLLREVLPLHDELCAEEGRYMLRYVAGDSEAAAKLAACEGQTRRLWERMRAAG